MECSTSEVDLVPISHQEPARPTGPKTDRVAEFESFADEIREELDPAGPIERLLADYVTQAAWRLKNAMERQRKRSTSGADDQESTPARSRIRPTVVEDAARTLRDGFAVFEACRSLQTAKSGSKVLIAIPEPSAIEPNEWPIVPSVDESIRDENDETPHYRDRLTFDFEVSDDSPVVKGTWVTVGHVVSLIIDGWTWADILRSHPELSENDIRACVAYAMDEENASR